MANFKETEFVFNRKEYFERQMERMQSLHFNAFPYQFTLNEIKIPSTIVASYKPIEEIDSNVIFDMIKNHTSIHHQKYGLYLLNLLLTQQRKLLIFSKINWIIDFNFIYGLCSLLLHTDIQIKYMTSYCLISLSVLPEEIEEKIYEACNLSLIFQSISINNESDLNTILVDIVTNCSVANDSNRQFFFENNIILVYLDLLKNRNSTKELNDKIVKSVSILSAIVSDHPEYVLSFKDIVSELKPFLLIKYKKESYYYYSLLLLNCLTSNSTELYSIFTNEEFIRELFDLYSYITDALKPKMLKLIINLLSISDTNRQVLIDNNVFEILKDSLIRYNRKKDDKDVLNGLIWSIANLFAGNIAQCKEITKSNIMKEVLSIAETTYLKMINLKCNYYIGNDNEEQDELQYNNDFILYQNISFLICNYAIGGSKQSKIDFVGYNNGIIIKMLCLSIKLYSKNKDLLWGILATFREYIIINEETMMMNIKEILLQNNIKELLNTLLIKQANAEYIQFINYLLPKLKE